MLVNIRQIWNLSADTDFCLLIGRKYDYMKSLFRSWNKSFSDDLSLKNHQRSKYWAKSDKTQEYWGQKEEEFNQESTDEIPDDSYDFKAAQDLDMECDTKRAPYGALEEIDNENLEEFSVDELQDVMVNLQESDIFYNKFMYNIINSIDNTGRTQELADFLSRFQLLVWHLSVLRILTDSIKA